MFLVVFLFLSRVFDLPRLLSEVVGNGLVVCDENVVEKHSVGHGPQFECNSRLFVVVNKIKEYGEYISVTCVVMYCNAY
jgi:hypothetical protein